jgi:hypothetical protein
LKQNKNLERGFYNYYFITNLVPAFVQAIAAHQAGATQVNDQAVIAANTSDAFQVKSIHISSLFASDHQSVQALLVIFQDCSKVVDTSKS